MAVIIGVAFGAVVASLVDDVIMAVIGAVFGKQNFNDLTFEIADGGPTSLDNLWRLCPHHHRLKTVHGWHVIGTPGRWDLVPPADPDPPDRGPP